MITVPYIRTQDGITLFFDNDNIPVSQADPEYRDIIKLMRNPDTTDDQLRVAVQPVRDRLNKVIEETPESGFQLDGSAVLYREIPINPYLAAKLNEMVDQGWDLKPMSNFIDKLNQNPSYRAQQDLYPFLEYGEMPITADGDFLAYKYVGNDYFDCHSHTFNNSVGQICEMPRNKVDENPDNTCSRGLHVCSYDYLPMTSGGCRIMVCKINPADVVAIPRDYNNTKMRVSRYHVIAEITEQHRSARKVLSERAAFENDLSNLDDDSDYTWDENDECYDSEQYEVRTFASMDDHLLDNYHINTTFDNFASARNAAYECFQNYDVVQVINTYTDEKCLQLSAVR